MYPASRPLIVLMLACVAWLAWLPAIAQQTIRIPEEQLEKIDDMPTNPMEGMDTSISPENPLRFLEDIVDQTQLSGSVPELIAEGVHGQTPIAREVPVVWELRVSGSWNEMLRGEGALKAIDLDALGVEPGQMISTVMRTDAREWPFMLGAYLPKGRELATRAITMPGADEGARGTAGLGGMTSHMFDPRRLPLASRQQNSTERMGGRVRVDTRGGAYRIHFSTSYRELGRDGRPTGRTGLFQGWVCEADAYERDPDSCLYDEFHIVSHTPTVDRANVNPQYPALTVVFSERVDPLDLVENFTLYTVDWAGDRVEVEGTWRESKEVGDWREEAASLASSLTMPEGLACSVPNTTGRDLRSFPEPSLQVAGDPHEYVFVPSTPLRPGTIYEAVIAGGEDGVQARYGGERLEDDHAWKFSTLLHLDEQHNPIRGMSLGELPPGVPEVLAKAQQHPIEVAVYQPVRDPRLVVGKPAMTRLYVDWSNDFIAEKWQPDKFEFEMVTSTYHARPMAQRNTPAHSRRLMWLEPQSAFDEEDRRHARHTVNLFGWLPRPDDAGDMEVVACPHDPFPFPMAEAETRQEHPVEIWEYDPGRLNFYYVVVHPSGVVGLGERLSEEAYSFVAQVMSQTLSLVPAFLPHRSARARRLNVPSSDWFVRESSKLDASLMARVNKAWRGGVIFHGIDHDVPFEREDRGSLHSGGTPEQQSVVLGAYLRMVQRLMGDRLSTDDIVVVVLPESPGSDHPEGMGLTALTGQAYRGLFLDYRSRGVSLVIDANGDFSAGQLAEALVHEFGHVFGLGHNPQDAAQVSDPKGHREPGIDGFRLAPGGLSGWNKHSEEGNAQSDTLVSLMWPVIVSPDDVMLTPGEYAAVQNDMRGPTARSFGWNQTPHMERRAWLASAAGATWLPHSGSLQSPSLAMNQGAAAQPAMLPTLSANAAGQAAAAGPASQHLIVSGMIAPDGQGLVIDALRLLDVAPEVGEGPFRVELLDADGDVLRSGAFDLEPASTSPESAASGSAWEPGNPMFWPEFRVALHPHEDAVALVVREGGDELVRLDLPASAPRLRLAENGPVRVGVDGATLRWSVEAGVEAVFDVEYSRTGQAPWRALSLGQDEPSIALDADMLEPGPAPRVRITAMSGLHGTQQSVPVALTRGPVPQVDLPDPESALAGAPPTLWFDAEPLASRVESHIQLRDGAGAVVPVEYFFLPGRGGLSLLPEDPLRPGETYSVHVTAGLPDRYGNVLEDDHRWSFETAAADP